ncbi:MAG: hypothetical protein IV110_05830 [Aquabacterium sp.]|uniref:hypothetical protein n=1 Tax=Aquabacterium sp. TaxID=1872578 RepID=UPI001DEF00D0|nr:hypothetical protein [Aquabacterium sp.]MBT9609544.1 hypothetical protein [Aquabacterium sp.]
MFNMSRWVRVAPLLLAVYAFSPWSQAAENTKVEVKCPAPASNPPVNTKDFELGCNGKAVCLLEDSLQIKKISKTAKLDKVALTFCDGGGHREPVIRSLNPGEDLATPLSLPLSGQLTDKLILANKNPGFWKQSTSANIHKNKLDVTVSLTVTEPIEPPPASEPKTKQVTYHQAITVDIAALWKSGLIKPLITGAACPKGACTFGQTLDLTIPALPAWLEATGMERSSIKLALYGTLLPGLVQDVTVAEPAALSFKLARGLSPDKGLDPWVSVLESVASQKEPLKVVLTNEQGQRLSEVFAVTDKTNFELPKKEAGIVPVIIFLVVLALIFGPDFGRRLVRDAPPVTELEDTDTYTMAYSLGKSQMLFWTALVFVSWAYLWWATGDPWNFNDTALILMGISSATAVGALASNPLPSKVQAWVTDLGKVNDQIAAITPGTTVPVALTDQKAALLVEINNKVKTSGWWITDVTRNVGDTETGLHRVQSLLFTLAFGLAFGFLVIQTMAMPVLPATALALLGISGTAYVGFKFADPKSATK